MPFTLAGLKAVVWTPLTFATVVIGLRVFVRIQTRTFRIEDYLILLAWTTAIVTAGLAEANLESQDPKQAGVYLYSGLLVGVWSLTFGKSSITLVLLHLLDRTAKRRKQYLMATLWLFLISSVACFVVNVIPACSTQKPPSMAPVCVRYSGIVQAAFVLVWSVLGALLDVSYSVIAWTVLYRTRLGREKKIGLFALFGLGWVAAPFSIIRPIVSGAVIGDKDLFWLSTSLELALVIIGASASFLMPLFQYLINGKPITPPEPYPQPTAESRQRLRSIVSRHHDNQGIVYTCDTAQGLSFSQEERTTLPREVENA